MKFRKKPVVIEARQFLVPEDGRVIARWVGPEHGSFLPGYTRIVITTREGTMYAEPGDWIIKGIAGEFYPCKPDIFAATYEPVDSEGGAPREEP